MKMSGDMQLVFKTVTECLSRMSHGGKKKTRAYCCKKYTCHVSLLYTMLFCLLSVYRGIWAWYVP